MSAVGLLADLRQRGVILTATGDRLQIDAPVGVLTESNRAALREHKAELLMLLGAVAPVAPLDEFSDLRAQLARGDLRGYGQLMLQGGSMIFDVEGYARRRLADLEDPRLAGAAALWLRRLQGELARLKALDAIRSTAESNAAATVTMATTTPTACNTTTKP
jgi:hypothetical protein